MQKNLMDPQNMSIASASLNMKKDPLGKGGLKVRRIFFDSTKLGEVLFGHVF